MENPNLFERVRMPGQNIPFFVIRVDNDRLEVDLIPVSGRRVLRCGAIRRIDTQAGEAARLPRLQRVVRFGPGAEVAHENTPTRAVSRALHMASRSLMPLAMSFGWTPGRSCSI